MFVCLCVRSGLRLTSVRTSQAPPGVGAYLPPPPHCQWLILEHPASAGGGKYWLTPGGRLVGPGPPGSVGPLLGCGGVSGLCAPCSVCSGIAGCQRRLQARRRTSPWFLHHNPVRGSPHLFSRWVARLPLWWSSLGSGGL